MPTKLKYDSTNMADEPSLRYENGTINEHKMEPRDTTFMLSVLYPAISAHDVVSCLPAI
jgi:hypothetical protein